MNDPNPYVFEPENWWQPAFNWKPWDTRYRLAAELGVGALVREYLRRLVVIVGATIFFAALPLIIIIALIFAAAAGSGSDTDRPPQQNNCQFWQNPCPAAQGAGVPEVARISHAVVRNMV